MEIGHFRLSLGLSSHLLLTQRKLSHTTKHLIFKSKQIQRGKKGRNLDVDFSSEAPLVLKFTESCHGGLSRDT